MSVALCFVSSLPLHDSGFRVRSSITFTTHSLKTRVVVDVEVVVHTLLCFRLRARGLACIGFSNGTLRLL